MLIRYRCVNTFDAPDAAAVQSSRLPSELPNVGVDIAHYEHDMLEIALSHIVGDATVSASHRSDMVEKRRKLMIEWAQYLSISNVH